MIDRDNYPRDGERIEALKRLQDEFRFDSLFASAAMLDTLLNMEPIPLARLTAALQGKG